MDKKTGCKIVLAPCIPSIMEQARVREQAGGAHCFYLGVNFLKARETLAWAKKHSMTAPEPARLFRDACVRTKPAYVEWMGQLSEQADSPEWWSLPISTKSPYLSPLFISMAHFEMIRSYISAHTVSELFLVVESPALADVLESHFRAAGRDVRRYRRNSAWSIKWAWLDFKRYLAPRLSFVRNEIMKRWRLRKCRRSLPPPGVPVTLIRTWFFANTIQNGRFRDIYFGDLAELIKTKGRRPLTVLNPYYPDEVDPLKTLLDSRDDCMAMEQVVGWLDILAIFFRTLRLPSIRFRNLRFNGVDVTPLVQYELRRMRLDPTLAFACLHVLFVRNLKRLQIRLEAVYFPFENQAWEKLFCMELRRCFPGVWIGGYQHAAVFDMLLPYYMSPAEIRVAPGPDAILTNGEFFANHFREEGYRDVRVVYPVRYMSLDQTIKSSPDAGLAQTPRHDFLICTPSVYPETLEMLHRLVHLFSGKDCKVAVKVHNLIDWDSILRSLRQIGVALPPEWEMVSGKLTDLILRSKAIMWSSSASYLDALALGTPVVHVVPSHTLDIEWIDLSEGCVHLYPEDTYETMMKSMDGLHTRNGSGAVREFVRTRLAFDAPMESFLPDLAPGGQR